MLTIHIKKDIHMVIKSHYILIFIIFWGLASLLIAQFSSFTYASNVSDITISQSQINEYQKETCMEYWENIAFVGGIFILIISSLFIADEEENGMSIYVSTYGINPYFPLLSKIITLMFMAAFLSLLSYVEFISVFWAENNFFVFPIQNFQASLILFGVIFALSSIGVFIGKMFHRRSICISVAMFYMIISTYISSVGIHLSGSYLSQHYLTCELEHLSNIPINYKIMIILNPIALMEAVIPTLNITMSKNEFSINYVSIFGLPNDILIIVAYSITFILLSCVVVYYENKFRGEFVNE